MQRRLTVQEYAEWRGNPVLLVGEDGSIFRDATPAEVQRGEAVTVRKKTFKLVPARKLLQQRLLEEAKGQKNFSSVRVKAPNGRFLKTLHQPASVVQRRVGLTVHPDYCQCRDWAGREPGRHHKICEIGKRAPIHEQATDNVLHEAGKRRLFVAANPGDVKVRQLNQVLETTGVTSAAPIPQHLIPSPAECVCATWQWPKDTPFDGGHRPICEWREQWEGEMNGKLEVEPVEALPDDDVADDTQRDTMPDALSSRPPASSSSPTRREAPPGAPRGGAAVPGPLSSMTPEQAAASLLNDIAKGTVVVVPSEGGVGTESTSPLKTATAEGGTRPPLGEEPAASDAADVAPDPSECECAGWDLPEGVDPETAGHHPTCQFAGLEPDPFYLYLAKTGEKKRVATAEEVGIAVAYEEQHGLPIVTVGDDVYFCKRDSE